MTDTDANQDSIGFILNDAARLFRRAFNARARDSGVTGLQWRLLAWLFRNPGIRQAALADLIEVEPITLSRMIDRLSEQGLVERRADPADRRAWQLYLTARAQPTIAHLRAIADTLVADALTGISADEQLALTTLTNRIRANLSRKEMIDG
jgi:DNA-binding MarR family transcriptional regulator